MAYNDALNDACLECIIDHDVPLVNIICLSSSGRLKNTYTITIYHSIQLFVTFKRNMSIDLFRNFMVLSECGCLIMICDWINLKGRVDSRKSVFHALCVHGFGTNSEEMRSRTIEVNYRNYRKSLARTIITNVRFPCLFQIRVCAIFRDAAVYRSVDEFLVFPYVFPSIL